MASIQCFDANGTLIFSNTRRPLILLDYFFVSIPGEQGITLTISRPNNGYWFFTFVKLTKEEYNFNTINFYYITKLSTNQVYFFNSEVITHTLLIMIYTDKIV